MNRIGNRSVIAMVLLIVVALLALPVGPDRFHDNREQNIATATQSAGSTIVVVDGDTVKVGGVTYRLVGFDTPERGDRALCDKERELAEVAAVRLQSLLASGEPKLERVACACKTGTEGSYSCNFGRSCAYLRVKGRDVGDILIREGLAQPFVCGRTSCPPRKPWC